MIRYPRLTAAAVLAAGLSGAPAAYAAPATYEIDPEHMVVGVLVEHIGYMRVLGTFLEGEGQFTFDPETKELGEVRVVIDAASFFSNAERRDRHVRSADFLDAEEFPDIVFEAAGGEMVSEGTGTITGDLTIRGETRPITLEVTLNKIADYPFLHEKETIGASIRGTVIRSEYGMTYAQGGIVGDEVELLIEIEAIRQD